jgi:hypothetical protein
MQLHNADRQSGYRYSGMGMFLFVLLADDRKTALAHMFCSGRGMEVCLSFDTGEAHVAWSNGNKDPLPGFTVTDDIAENCVSYTPVCDSSILTILARVSDPGPREGLEEFS